MKEEEEEKKLDGEKKRQCEYKYRIWNAISTFSWDPYATCSEL